MLSDAFEAFAQIFSPPLRKVMWKSLFLTAAVLLALALCLDRLAASIMPLGPAWLTWFLSIAVAVGLLAGVILLAPPTASLVAGFYLDDVAASVANPCPHKSRRTWYPISNKYSPSTSCRMMPQSPINSPLDFSTIPHSATPSSR